MTKMSDLPRYLEEEIVSRVPLKHMRAVRMTCKKWNALFQSRSFTTMNIGKEEARRELDEFRMIMLMDYSIHLMRIVVNENLSTKSLGKLTSLNDSEQVKISQFYDCEGLLLLRILKNDDGIWRNDNTKIVVWNPYLGQTRWIKTSNNFCSRKIINIYEYAMGYEDTSGNKSPKILRFIDDFEAHPENPALLYEIYDFESDLWTSLDVCPRWCMMSDCGVSLKGNTYWGVKERKTYSSTDHILCFDFTTERFGPLIPLPFPDAYPEFASLSCGREEKLVVLFETSDYDKMEIWITTKVEPTQVSWSNFVTMNIPSCLDDRLSHKSFLVDEEKKVLMVFDEQGLVVCYLDRVDYVLEVESLVLEEPGQKMHWPIVCWPLICSYVPSLVQSSNL